MAMEALARPKDADDALAALEGNGIERVHVGIFDLDAAFREQRLPIDQVRRALAGGYSFCNVLHKWNSRPRAPGAPDRSAGARGRLFLL